MFPEFAIGISVATRFARLGLVDDYLGLILAHLIGALPFMAWILVGTFADIPRDLEEAAAIDGYGTFGFLFRIVVPLSTPILATVSVLTLVASWNNFFTPLLVLNTQKRFTLPLGVMDFMGEHAADWNMILAFLTLAMVPAVLIYVLCQRYIVAGLAAGAIKG
jgi:raffinose/stachyose/melibiose transport system permease protein